MAASNASYGATRTAVAPWPSFAHVLLGQVRGAAALHVAERPDEEADVAEGERRPGDPLLARHRRIERDALGAARGHHPLLRDRVSAAEGVVKEGDLLPYR